MFDRASGLNAIKNYCNKPLVNPKATNPGVKVEMRERAEVFQEGEDSQLEVSLK